RHIAATNLALTLVAVGHFDRAMTLTEAACEFAQRTGAGRLLFSAALNLASAANDAGHVARGLRAVAVCQTVSAGVDRARLLMLDQLRGALLREAGDVAAAR